MNEENLNIEKERSIKTQQDAQAIQENLLEKRELIIAAAPKLILAIKDAPFHLETLFEMDGTPKGDFRVTDRYKKKVFFAFKHPHIKSTTGKRYYGELTTSDFSQKHHYPNEYLILVNPTFLTESELHSLRMLKTLTKRVNNVEITFVPANIQYHKFSSLIEEYMESIAEPRKRIEELDSIIADIEQVKTKLPRGSYEVNIEQTGDDFTPGFSNK